MNLIIQNTQERGRTKKMAEYIDREAILRHLDECKGTPPEICYTYPIFVALECFVKNLPAADVAEVKHGEWIPQVVLGDRAWDCSECKTLGSPQWKWCPVCGALMKG